MTLLVLLDSVPIWVIVFFIGIAILTILLFQRAFIHSIPAAIIFFWMIVQSLIAWTGAYIDHESVPPKLMLGMIPVFLSIFALLILPGGRKWLRSLNLKALTLVHVVRIPVEIALYLLAGYGLISHLQTFEGWNFDIVCGITAPIIFLLAFGKNNQVKNKRLLLGWNIVCLLLLINIIVISVMALESPFQCLSMDQPNVAMMYFPFNLLPMVIVPIVIISHLAAILQLTGNRVE
jgi:hypothetical protein